MRGRLSSLLGSASVATRQSTRTVGWSTGSPCGSVVRCRYHHLYDGHSPLCHSACSSSSARACSSTARGTAGVRGWCAWGRGWGTSPVGSPAGRGGTASLGRCPACGRCATSPGVTLAPRAPAPLPASRVVSPSARVGRPRQVPRGRHREGATCLAVWLSCVC